jgi:GNAT superfamily N-acetyltransferase
MGTIAISNPTFHIAPIQEEHYLLVGDLFQQCFDTPAPPSEEYVRNLCHTDPEGCLLAWVDSTPVGFGCVHSRGSVGYLGPSGVLKEYRGRGYGKALIEARVQYLASRCVVIGLETWGDNGGNIGRDYRLGFRETYPCREMGKQAATEKSAHPLPAALRPGTEIPAEMVEAVLSQIRLWTNAILPGLDFTKDLTLFLSHYPDRVLFYFDNEKPCGFVAQHDLMRGETWFAVEPSEQDEQVFTTLLAGWEQVNWPNGVSFHYHTHCARLTPLLLECGYQVWRDTVCMTLETHTGPFAHRMTTLFGYPWWS